MKQLNGIVDSAAKAYFLSYKCLIDKHIEVCNFYSDNISVYLFPAITTAAFSCELALKHLAQTESGKTPRGHDLYKLFNKLNESTRIDIMNRTIQTCNLKSELLNVSDRISEFEFRELLISHKDTFTIWRYYYEGLPKDVDLDFIEGFMFSLNDVEGDYFEYVLNRLALKNSNSINNVTR